MICTRLNGGLGNQMFQYALGRAISIKNKTELILDTSILDKNFDSKAEVVRDFELGIFEIEGRKATVREINFYNPLIYKITNSLLLRFGFKGITNTKYYIEQSFSYDYNVLKVSKNSFLSGYWQSPLYFESIENVIRKDFKFPTLNDQKNVDISKKIISSNSVSIHIRRGDFLNTIIHGIHGTCSLDYYKSSISYIYTKITDPIFFIFSDDIEWVKENLKLDSERYYISGNNGNNSYIDMQLMSYCKHNIIANSSFSWWGGWLNKNPLKIVIAPKVWFTDNNINQQTNNLLPKTWIRK